jgi:hypothetical protein
MKKILFLSFEYPYGHFGASSQCSYRIMEAISQSKAYEVHNISYCGIKNNYRTIDGVQLHLLDFPERKRNCPRWIIQFFLFLKIPFFPFTKLFNCIKVYRACKSMLRNNSYDLVVAQCNPEESVWAGTWLKKNGYVDRLIVIFWDNVYGKLPRRVIPKGFALRRQRKAENEIAKYADSLVSLYPIKAFHEVYGDVPNAGMKRVYLGIPSITRPKAQGDSSYEHVIKLDKINILYSGTVFRKEYVSYFVDLLNRTSIADRINLIFFSQGVSDDVFAQFQKSFKGSVQYLGWIPINELLALYPKVDFFVSFPGVATAIRSKVYEYMSFGKPLILLFDDDNDVNVSTFSRYSAYIALDERQSVEENARRIEPYILGKLNVSIPFEEVEKVFPEDTAEAYVRLIEKLIQ